MLTVYVVSDATGSTADRILRAALVQFGNAALQIVHRTQVRKATQVQEVVREAAANAPALLLHTLVSHDLRGLMLAECRERGVDAMDLLGPLLDRLAASLRVIPQEQPGLFKQLLEARSREIEAVDYAFKHDDGHNMHELDRAEVVLVGVSRSMKTPTMLYLAYRGWLAANVPLIPGIPVPQPLLDLPPERVFCLLVSPERLMELRRVRARLASIPEDSYASPKQVADELLYARRMSLERGWRTIEVTGKSVEETSLEVITLRGLKR